MSNSKLYYAFPGEEHLSECTPANFGFRPFDDADNSSIQANSTPYSHYIDSVSKIIDDLKLNGGKTVYARVISGHTKRSPRDIANEYHSKYPDTFRFVLEDSEWGVWIGASPELLLKISVPDNKTYSCALAGTMPVSADGQWDRKNIDEHRIVVDYISQTLESFNLNPRCSQTETVKFGIIQHLKTPISADFTTQPFELLDTLSPTPALCGYPKETAMSHIAEYEDFNRALYGGYIWVKDYTGSVTAYVNLRCVRLIPTGDGEWHFTIFAGGGITPQSTPQNEWAETELKAKVLLECINGKM